MIVSLRRRMLLILMGLTLVIWLVSVVITAVVAQHMIVRQIDRQLTQYMDMAQYNLSVIMKDSKIREYFQQSSEPISSNPHLRRIKGFGSQGRDQATNLWFDKLQVLVGEETPIFPQPVADGIVTASLNTGGEEARWHIMYRYNPMLNIWLSVGVDMRHAQNIGAATLWRVILPLLIILPVTAAVLLWGVGRGLQPLIHLADKIAQREPQTLEPIDMTDVPMEMRPVVTSLNGLLERLQRTLKSEQRFTSNAAHELQTPLAAIKAEVQRCQRQTNDANTQMMLERISARVARSVDTVRQLLTLARLDSDQAFQRERVELYDLIVDVIADVGAIAADRAIEVRLEAGELMFIEGNVEWLKIMLRNVLINAFSHSPAPDEVEVRLLRRGEETVVMIANDCEPIPEREFARLTDRFYRLSGSSSQGVGLGLSIVLRIAQLHRAALHLSARRGGRGFVAELRFPTYSSSQAGA